MKPASRTARGTALHRAAHQVLEAGAIFTDPFAVAVLGEVASTVAAQEGARPGRRPMRLFIAARSRFADDAAAAAYVRIQRHRGPRGRRHRRPLLRRSS